MSYKLSGNTYRVHMNFTMIVSAENDPDEMVSDIVEEVKFKKETEEYIINSCDVEWEVFKLPEIEV